MEEEGEYNKEVLANFASVPPDDRDEHGSDNLPESSDNHPDGEERTRIGSQ